MRCLLLLICLVLAAAAVAGPAAPRLIHAYYFTEPICPSCTTAHNVLAELLAHDAQVQLHTINVFKPREYEVAEALLTVAGVDERELPLGPGLLVGSTYVNRNQFSRESVLAALDRYRATGAPNNTGAAMRVRGHARESLPRRLRQFGLWPLLLAGLLDGINPCAFATLVFFLSYLGMVGTRRWPLLRVGLVFALGVFGAYFAFGFGLLNALWALDSLPLLRQGLYLVMGAVALLFALLSWRDSRAVGRGDFSAVTLQMPQALKRHTHGLIRRGVRSAWLYPASFVIGLAVAALELACTGQVYIPALVYLLSLDGSRAAALGWLLLYDVMFIVPLLALLLVVARGVSSGRLRAFAERQAGRTKLYLALFFVLCAAYFATKAAGL